MAHKWGLNPADMSQICFIHSNTFVADIKTKIDIVSVGYFNVLLIIILNIMEISNPLVLVPQSNYQDILKKLDCLEKLIKHKEINDEWLESEKARKQLGIGKRTWQMWRDKRVLPFAQFGRCIWVRQTAIEDFLLSNEIKGGGRHE